MKLYEVKRKFTGGILVGLTHTGLTTIFMPVGFICNNDRSGDPYEIISCVEVPTQ